MAEPSPQTPDAKDRSADMPLAMGGGGYGGGDRTAEVPEKKPGGETRPQRGGEAATTRFGMEDGDNRDIPATGGPTAD